MKKSMRLFYFYSSWCYLLTSVLPETYAQRRACNSLEWSCKNGDCISDDERCDGVVNCRDGSDETAEFCLDVDCPVFAFKCTYGACVSGNAKCNGVKECLDNSDESPGLCLNQTGFPADSNCAQGQFQCKSGECIPTEEVCDGSKSCRDGSDETVTVCSHIDCPGYSFKCAYGACVRGDAKCDHIQNCLDGSDESLDVCPNRTVVEDTSPRVTLDPMGPSVQPSRKDKRCRIEIGPQVIVVPEYNPNHIMRNGELANNYEQITYKCEPKYHLFGTESNTCLHGNWVFPIPECSKACPAKSITGVTYTTTCIYNHTTIPCTDPIRPHTRASVSCAVGYRKPNRVVYDNLVCDQTGEWDYPVYSCEPECGQEPIKARPFVVGGSFTRVPWHAAIYKQFQAYEHICGGTIINAKLVVSAAHCFVDRDYTKYAVVVGKINRAYSAQEQYETQSFSLSEIHVPPEYQGPDGFYHNDIAILVLTNFIHYHDHIKPICINWEPYTHRNIVPETLGKIAGWGKTSEGGPYSEQLKYIELPVISKDDCIKKVSSLYDTFVNGEKFCVGSPDSDGSACSGDSGGGFVTSKYVEGKLTHFLWGVLSANLGKNDCAVDSYVTFTNIQHHKEMIREYDARFRPR